tara:strand:- start:49 stop:357 length:309 start_codon:yes stop_codon:yes gene_type:complete
MSKKSGTIEKAKEFIEKYGWKFLAVYWIIFFSCVGIVTILIALGLTGEAKFGYDALLAAYVITKILQPARILLSVGVTYRMASPNANNLQQTVSLDDRKNGT